MQMRPANYEHSVLLVLKKIPYFNLASAMAACLFRPFFDRYARARRTVVKGPAGAAHDPTPAGPTPEQ